MQGTGVRCPEASALWRILLASPHSTFPLAKGVRSWGGASLGGCSQGAGDKQEPSRGRQELSEDNPFGAHRMEVTFLSLIFMIHALGRKMRKHGGIQNITLILLSGEKHLMLPFHSSLSSYITSIHIKICFKQIPLCGYSIIYLFTLVGI